MGDASWTGEGMGTGSRTTGNMAPSGWAYINFILVPGLLKSLED